MKRGQRLVRSWIGVLRRPFDARPRAGRVPRRPRAEATASGVTRRDIERLVGMPVGDLGLYEHALRHRSMFRGTTTTGTESNERLEFLGDAVLGAAVAERLYDEFPDRDEGFLTRMRANLVNGQTLADYARAIGLGPLILMSDNMASSEGRENQTILADAFEAIVGALYLDLGFGAARGFVFDLLDRLVDLPAVSAQRSNYKSMLLEFVQARGWPQPTYEVAVEEGPSHDRRFTIDVLVDGAARGRGTARSKKQAEQAAAREALDALRRFEDASAEAPRPTKTIG
ncbi:MAG: ribonuclease III [Rubricoccaceae bacterium]|nr:ribonuclease III [Rubricoccaceae bacterium]